MITKHKIASFVLLTGLAVFAVTADAEAQCCGTPSYAAAYQTYSPVAYTAYQPVSSWYPGCCLTRWWSGMWGGGYSAAYAPTYSTYYRPAYYASYATSYAPVSSYSTCTSCYAPSCTTCYDPCSSCASCSSGCSSCGEGSGCSSCGVTQASATESYPVESYPSRTQPQLAPSENPPTERTYESDKPAAAEEDEEVYPKPSDDSSDESASFFEAPRLFNPKDQTALGNGAAPVRTAVYHTPVAGQPSTMRNISVSRQQARLDAEGWTSVSQ